MKHFVLKLVFFLGTPFCMVQNTTVKGKIVGFKKYSLKNVKVSSKKSKTEVFSDSLGNFSIKCKKKDQLLFSAGRFHGQRIKTNGEESIYVNYDCNSRRSL